MITKQIKISGAVQGVGFRPFIYNLANSLGVRGSVSNTSGGVEITIQADEAIIELFLKTLNDKKPSLAIIQNISIESIESGKFNDFVIQNSEECKIETLILPDVATCVECSEELFDNNDRRYLYPFINCTNCGPRFSIVNSLPYDRQNTSMKDFAMCDKCQSEYDDPTNRRFHAQPNACTDCGPQVFLCEKTGDRIESKHLAFERTAIELAKSKIIAVKGIGGFHLMCNAIDDIAVNNLRSRKKRGAKPFALMYASIDQIKNDCFVNEKEEQLLCSYQGPIVLVKKKDESVLSKSIAPNNPNLGVMLACNPIHQILLSLVDFPVVATSANVSEEPICIENIEAISELTDIADLFLMHDRKIVRHVDDSIVRVVAENKQILRRARGYAPLPIEVKSINMDVLAVGGHLKNAVALSKGSNVFISQHIGDLETNKALGAFEKVINDFKRIYEIDPKIAICDIHPDYLSSRYACDMYENVNMISHHRAHIYSVMAEHALDAPVLGVAFDGTGFGDDGTIWGGEFITVDGGDNLRVACLRGFNLPGVDIAVKESRRSFLGLMYEYFGENLKEYDAMIRNCFTRAELDNLLKLLDNKVNCVYTTSAGRWFDAISALLGICYMSEFEGQAATGLEHVMQESHKCEEAYGFNSDFIEKDQIIVLSPDFIGIINDVKNGISRSDVSYKFHNMLVEMIVYVAKEFNIKNVALSGGCFANKYLTENVINKLKDSGFSPFINLQVPPNDGGISLGQIYSLTQIKV